MASTGLLSLKRARRCDSNNKLLYFDGENSPKVGQEQELKQWIGDKTYNMVSSRETAMVSPFCCDPIALMHDCQIYARRSIAWARRCPFS